MTAEQLLADLLATVRTDGLKWNPATKEHEDIKVAPYAFIRAGEDHVTLSAEDGHYFADYYGEYRGGYPWIHPDVEAWAKKHGMFWEWENAGCLGLYQA